MRYRKRPLIIEAIVFPDDGPGQFKVSQWVSNNGGELKLYDGCIEKDIITDTGAVWHWVDASLKTLEGSFLVSIGDWIIKGIKGEFYPCKPDIFRATYDQVEE